MTDDVERVPYHVLTPDEQRDRLIREISGRGHQLGVSTSFAYSALAVYEAGGKMPPKDEKALKTAGLLDEYNSLTADGMILLTSCEQRGDHLYLWAKDMIAKAEKAPKLVLAAA